MASTVSIDECSYGVKMIGYSRFSHKFSFNILADPVSYLVLGVHDEEVSMIVTGFFWACLSYQYHTLPIERTALCQIIIKQSFCR